MNSIQLSLATTEDIASIYQLAEKIWLHHYVPIIGLEQVEYMLSEMYSSHSLHLQMNEKKHLFYLIKNNENNIGFISISGDEEKYIHKFYIDQDIQSKGIGSEVFRKLLELYPDTVSYTLTVNRKNYKSINFYFKLGFKIDHVDDFDIGRGYFMNDFIMKWHKIKRDP